MYQSPSRLSAESRAQLSALLNAEGAFKTLPFRDGLEAFFAAALRRV